MRLVVDIFKLPDHAQLILYSLRLAAPCPRMFLLLQRLAGTDNSSLASTVPRHVTLLRRVHVRNLELRCGLMR